MVLQGWRRKYDEILDEFGFSKREDLHSARLLESLLGKKTSLYTLEQKIRGRLVFVIGAGPSLSASIPTIKGFQNVTKIVADGATRALIDNHIRPDIVVTDLDGNLEYLIKASKRNCTMVVHAHGDNIGVLPVATLFKDCIGTTEGRPFGKIRNFGGFTDGDRCVFLAKHFGAKKIVMFGMDFGKKIGVYSKENRYNKKLKLAKLAKARELLEWLASEDNGGLYTTSVPLRGFKKIRFEELESLVDIVKLDL